MPTVSIILPTYNRASFLPEALAAIQAQTWTDWELIVVDDGSKDDTQQLIPELTGNWRQRVRYIHQENQGPAAARNRGIQDATGDYYAFYDSDDLWLPHHLTDCVEALAGNHDVDWVYGACRIVNLLTGDELAPNCFYADGQPRPFLSLKSRRIGRLSVIDDTNAAHCQILHGLFCGLQNSVIARRVLKTISIPNYRVGEDQILTIKALLAGFRLGYFDNIHVIYRIHDTNSSGATTNIPQRIKSLTSVIHAHQELLDVPEVTGPIRRAIRQRLANEYFWHLGYATHWMNGDNLAALANYRRGIAAWPWDWRFYKTYAWAALRTAAQRVAAPYVPRRANP
jgi:glycosyltransferase involved in cell wall biosynthesis